jgi:hypothetical protein
MAEEVLLVAVVIWLLVELEVVLLLAEVVLLMLEVVKLVLLLVEMVLLVGEGGGGCVFAGGGGEGVLLLADVVWLAGGGGGGCISAGEGSVLLAMCVVKLATILFLAEGEVGFMAG